MSKTSIGNVIRQERMFRNMTQAAAADAADMSASYLSAIENGKQSMTIEYLYKIAKAFDTTASSLIAQSEIDYETQSEKNNYYVLERESQYAKRQERIHGLVRKLQYCTDEEFAIFMDSADLQWNTLHYIKEKNKI